MGVAEFVALPLPLPLLLRALVLGVFGGVGLALTTFFSRRGPLIFPVYTALLVALALLLARYPAGPAATFGARYAAAFAGFAVAALMHYAAVCVHAGRDRRRLGFTSGVPLLGHVWRLTVLLGAGAVLSAGVARVAA